MRRGPLAAIALVAGCLQPSSHECVGGWVCPADLQCAAAPTYCGIAMQVDKCAGLGEWDACAYVDGNMTSGSCRGGVCEMCTPDREGCAGPNTGWFGMTSPVSVDLSAIVAPRQGEAYAVGQGGTLVGYDGTGWSAITTDPPLPGDLVSIWGTGSDDLYIVSSATAHNVIHVGANHTWTDVAMPSGGGAIKAITGTAANDVHAAGLAGSLCDYDGTIWTLGHGSPGPTFNAVSSGARGRALAVGNQGYVASYDGTSWTIMQPLPVAVMTAPLAGVWQAASDAVVVGPAPATGSSPTLVYTTAGGWMSQTPGGLTDRSLYGVWGVPEAVYAVGNRGLILRTTDRSTWSGPLVTPTQNDLAAIAGSSATDLFAVGRGGVILRSLGD